METLHYCAESPFENVAIESIFLFNGILWRKRTTKTAMPLKQLSRSGYTYIANKPVYFRATDTVNHVKQKE